MSCRFTLPCSSDALKRQKPAARGCQDCIDLGRGLELRMLLDLFENHQDERFTGTHLIRIVAARLRLLERGERLLDAKGSSCE